MNPFGRMKSSLLQRQIRLNAAAIADIEDNIYYLNYCISVTKDAGLQKRANTHYRRVSSLRKKLKKLVELQNALKVELQKAYSEEYFYERIPKEYNSWVKP